MSERQDEALDTAEQALPELFGDSFEVEEHTVEAPPADTPSPVIIDDQGRARDESGKFTSLKEEEPVAEEEPGEPEVVQEDPEDTPGDGVETPSDSQEEGDLVFEIDDPEILEYLDKYDGDVIAALKAAREGQSLIGRQGQELGDLRKELQERLDSIQEGFDRQQRVQQIDWETLIDENPEQAAVVAYEYQNMEAFGAAYDALFEISPFRANIMLEAMKQAEQQSAAPPPADLGVEVEALKAKYPDLQDRLPVIQEMAAERPVMAQALNTGDPRSRAQALEDLYLLAKSRSSEADTSGAARRVILRAKAEADAAKADATVLSASKSSAAGETGPTGNDLLQQTLRTELGLDDLVIV